MSLSETDENRVLRSVQQAVPLEPDPFARIARECELPEAAVLDLLHRWTERGLLREISGILEGSNLGYDSALVAGAIPEEDLERVVAIVNEHPTVTHNYLRNHAYNLWFTLAVPFEMGLERTLDVLARTCGYPFRALRRTATFKIGVNFDLRSRTNRTEAAPLPRVEPQKLSEADRRLFRALQTPLPIGQRPFDALGDSLGVEADELLAFGRRHLGGALRRYVGTLRHRKLGIRANAMVVWRVPPERLGAAGEELARAPEVSHCYARNPIENFPYTLYSMLHGPELETCETTARRLAERLQLPDYALLVSLEEFKKTRLRYFLPELDAWWASHALTGSSR